MRNGIIAAALTLSLGCSEQARGEPAAPQAPPPLPVKLPGLAGAVPAGLPAHLAIGLAEQNGEHWLHFSGVPWDLRYMYLTKGWANNWGYGQYDGGFAKGYMKDSASDKTIPVLTWYQMNGEPGGGEAQFLAKAQNKAVMKVYFSDFKLLMQRAKELGKPVIVHVEPDGFGFLEQQSGGKPSAPAAVASTGLPELAGLPDTVAGWGLAFLQLRKAAGASNVLLAVHISSWATGVELATHDVAAPLQPVVDQAYAFLSPMGLATNPTGATWDLLAGDPLDRDADFYVKTQGVNPWWNAGDSAPVKSASFNRYAEWLRIWNQASGKRWMLWQIPVGNSNHLNVPNNGKSREGFKDNRVEYFFTGDHLRKFASMGVVAMLFGAGASGQSSYQNDTWTDGEPLLKTRAAAFFKAGGLALPAPGAAPMVPTSESASAAPAPAGPPPKFTATASASAQTIESGEKLTLTATIQNAGGAMTDGIVDWELTDGSGKKAAQQPQVAQSFAAGESRQITWTLPAPGAAGTYKLAIGLFGTGWQPMHSWIADAASFSVTVNPKEHYGFEDGTQGWASGGNPISKVSSSTEQKLTGGHSLALSFTGGQGTQDVKVADPGVPAGRLVTFQIWVPEGHPLVFVQPFLLQNGQGNWAWKGDWHAAKELKPGAWAAVTLQVPANSAPLAQLGLQFATSAPWTGTIYVDSITW
jgi:hypothetical protein